MNIYSKNHSSYPRVGDTPELQRLRKAYNMLDKGKTTPNEVAKILDETVTEILDEQIRSGCDIVTDGQIRAYDPLSYLAGKINGFEITGLLRFFDTNYLYRQPRVKGELLSESSLVVDDFKYDVDRAGTHNSVVMFGPYSLLKMSTCETDFEDRLAELIEIYRLELFGLKAIGANLVQLDEPAIVNHPEDMQMFKAVYERFDNRDEMPEILTAFYFADITPIVENLYDLNVDGMIFDFCYSPSLTERLKGFDKDIGLGIIDGRNTKMESSDSIAKMAESVFNVVSSSNAYITTSCGLEFLPRGRAYDKLKLAADAVSLLKGGN